MPFASGAGAVTDNKPNPNIEKDMGNSKDIIRFLIKRLIGPEKVLLDFGYLKSQDELEKKLLAETPKDKTVYQWTNFVLTVIFTRDEFLKY